MLTLLLSLLAASPYEEAIARNHYRSVLIAERRYDAKLRLFVDITHAPDGGRLWHAHTTRGYEQGLHFGRLNGRVVIFLLDLADPEPHDYPVRRGIDPQ